MQISLCPSIGCGKEITRICSTRGELETAVTQLEERAARRKRQRKNREASWRSLFENECSCRGDNEDDDEEDDDDGGSLSDDFLVDDDLADTNDDERQDVTFWARVTREMDTTSSWLSLAFKERGETRTKKASARRSESGACVRTSRTFLWQW